MTGVYHMHPPTDVCLNKSCKYTTSHLAGQPFRLANSSPVHVVYHSREHGPVPAVRYSTHCPNCRISYYPDYYVDPATHDRVYYLQKSPRVIQIATHEYIEVSLCERFANSASAACNNSRIYNAEHAAAISTFPSSWTSNKPPLTPKFVSDAFFLSALLKDHQERGDVLKLSNDGTQAVRLDSVLQARTRRLAGPGRENWGHRCLRCSWETRDVHGNISVVMDGVTIGRPCCGIKDCKRPLPTQRDHFCTAHERYNQICVVLVCDQPRTDGFKTCSKEDHRRLEKIYQPSAYFVLRRRLRKTGSTTIEADEDTNETTPELVEVDADGECEDIMETEEEQRMNADAEEAVGGDQHCPSKPDEGNKAPRARFGRRRTHNEQLVVACCGVILGRATFYGSEAPHGAQHLQANRVSHFDKCAFPVDAFHAKTKHKESDAFCNTHCNAARWPELRDGDKWRFNSSAAEMTNAWFGGFQAIVREMKEEKYDFYLDEMITLRNRLICAELAASGQNPIANAVKL
ncbi:uncharacterized protein BXZ73DRAFT_53402 [Epithele typhae]|uniref:uncharacterized protein n=1 Tax=Epithele typhae TaxID=378194 RepID=UPI0020085F58|nr:uncharacterized protein BXZ73DRAFT_53402 [Epithele typhae]KAH9917121.1 hypothetical protein BXZ73DRAFT_53402 [Epithele typhae]